ncbi:MAG TPA: ATP-binding cassette domain-containing protein, partial [Thermoanaerobaculia bacterium]|nr:ATP-binding cassette domain-containing protein [Thermoanaerobaculia bacterium]
MSGVALRFRNLGKRYRLGSREVRHTNLREHLVHAAAQPIHRLRAALQGNSTILSKESIWALRGVSLDVEAGEVVGVIGRNGAGKTTLLKILSRITEPTEGRAEIHGRVASLLEVGTGFHPELTGRENIYLNGAIL